MTTNKRQSHFERIIFFAAIAYALLNAFVGAYAEAETGPAAMIAKVEAVWAEGLTSSNTPMISLLVEDILSEDDLDRFRGAELLERLMEVKSPIGNEGDEDLVVLERLVLHLIASDSLSPTAAERNSMLVARFLGMLRSEIIPGFSRLPVSTNIGPPLGVPGFAGMSPETIKDPLVRAEYERAIQENMHKVRLSRRQYTLSKIEKTIAGRIVDYLSKLAQNTKIDHLHLDRCMAEAKLNSDEKLKFMDGLRSVSD